MAITGKEFNETYPNANVVKLTVADNNHNGFQYKEGLNHLPDNDPFNDNPVCDKGGLYCCFKKDFGLWFHYGDKYMANIWSVTIPDDAKVVVMDNKIKVDRFILSNMEPLLSRDNCLTAVGQYGGALSHVPKELRDKEMCLTAVGQCGLVLCHVPLELRDKEMCLTAVRQYGLALEYVPPELRDKEMCRTAVRQDGGALHYVPEELQYEIKKMIS